MVILIFKEIKFVFWLSRVTFDGTKRIAGVNVRFTAQGKEWVFLFAAFKMLMRIFIDKKRVGGTRLMLEIIRLCSEGRYAVF